MTSDEEPAGDPRDPRFDQPHVRRSRRRWLPTWAVAVLVALVTAMTINLVRFGAGLTRVLEALAFAALVCVPVVALLLFADRRSR